MAFRQVVDLPRIGVAEPSHSVAVTLSRNQELPIKILNQGTTTELQTTRYSRSRASRQTHSHKKITQVLTPRQKNFSRSPAGLPEKVPGDQEKYERITQS